jgi:hypothetical protein
MRAALASAALAALCGAGAGQPFPPRPNGTGWCRDVLDNPFDPNFYKWTKCCVTTPGVTDPIW